MKQHFVHGSKLFLKTGPSAWVVVLTMNELLETKTKDNDIQIHNTTPLTGRLIYHTYVIRLQVMTAWGTHTQGVVQGNYCLVLGLLPWVFGGCS